MSRRTASAARCIGASVEVASGADWEALIPAAVTSRAPLDGTAETYSGAALERIRLADGRRLVLKHLPADGDWLTRASAGLGRARRLWESGLLARLAAVVDHTVLDVLELDGQDVLVMRDASAQLLRPAVSVSRRTSRRLLAGLAAMHEAGRSEPAQPLCSIAARYGLFAPAVHAADRGPGAHPAREAIVAGWEIFSERVAPDVAAMVSAVHRDPEPLGRRLGRHVPTVVHGDAKLENLGLGPSGLVAIDWGDLTGFGPAEIDVAWYALMNTWRIGGSPDDVFADYEAAAGHRLEREALDLACVGSLAQMGFKLAGRAVRAPEADVRAAAASQLAWWTARVRAACERVGSV
jgi:hypothetical protein